jgi:hypothetical protein
VITLGKIPVCILRIGVCIHNKFLTTLKQKANLKITHNKLGKPVNHRVIEEELYDTI